MPTPRPGVYELYWRFAYERQQIFHARRTGKNGPWTSDPILLTYKFCNTYRANDRVTQFLINDICYPKTRSSPDDMLFQIVAFRFFSKIETWQSIQTYLGRAPIIDDLVTGKMTEAIEYARESGAIYTSAFILCAADAYGQPKKYLNHVELFKDMFVNHTLGAKIRQAKSLKAIYLMLHDFPLIGDFMAYQIAIDLNYSDIINFSENEFSVAGPGALRGIQKVFQDTSGMTAEEIILWMVEHQDEEFKRLGYDFKSLHGRKLTAIDCQGLFCETDKYCREAAPNLLSARKKIKTKFTMNVEPITYTYPPKWGLTIS